MSDTGRIPLCIPHLAGNEEAYLRQCVETNWVSTAGPFVDRFESEMAAYVGTDNAVATASGTAALHVALLVAGVKPGDEVLTSTLTFIAPANAIRYTGAHPVFVDAEDATWQMDPQRVRAFLEEGCERRGAETFNRRTGRRVSALLPVHILGHPVDMDPLVELAAEFGLAVVEDATESLGASYKGRAVGTLGDCACLSFNGNKLMTAGGGGMVLTARNDWANRVRHLTTQAKADGEEFIHDEVGFNYRLSNLHAALGTAQLERLDALIEAKRRIAEAYRAACEGTAGLTFMPEADWADSVFWLSTVLVDADAYGCDSRGLRERLRAAGVESRPLWQPMHLSPAHAGAQALGGAVAERLYASALSLPSSAGLDEAAQARVLEVVVGG